MTNFIGSITSALLLLFLGVDQSVKWLVQPRRPRFNPLWVNEGVHRRVQTVSLAQQLHI